MEDENIINSSTKGHILFVGEEKEYKPKKHVLNFRLRTDESYPQILEFTLYDKGIEKLKSRISEGDQVLIKFNVKGREYNERVYHTLQPWSIEVLKELETKEDEEENDFDDEDVPF